ncbi:aldo/keto reductase [Faecalicatena sp. AGMB00832]|uniref:Aldo/keto reductase n=1 Tax=Faecalicatena faecalis TaxID=2726362 RepID=A0ABS6D7M7_9FIRM|nr:MULTISPECIES: aldo/keto reductase [Faecalicatena]MBU3877609.1 aldo/keto reductase [Faecalicatena faecalis]MCI6463916.1 aldo/keto reductase [Faecalicatena sp.]MDY5620816.1 aldo/keto reductase [Lachnospiraceae bacterium]
MDRIVIPNTELSVSQIGLGTVGAGIDWDGADADRIFDTYLDLGGNVIDSAHVYSDWIPPEIARSERVVGDWLQRSGKRKEIVLITKGGHPDMLGEHPDIHISRMRKSDMVGDLEASLRQLRTDYIDIYFYHRDDIKQPVEQLVDVMQGFVKEGKIRYYACSNWSARRMKEAEAYTKKMGYRGFIANQALLNVGSKYMKPLADDTMEAVDEEMYRYHKENTSNLLMPYMGVCSGFFHIYISKGEEAVKNSPYYTKNNLQIAEHLKKLMGKYGCTVSQTVLGFFMQQEFSCVPLYGPQNIEQLRDAMETPEIPFSKEDYDFQ